MKVGDLIRVKDDPHNFCGMGLIYEKDGRHLVKVLWFYDALNDRKKWEQVTHFEVINETQV